MKPSVKLNNPDPVFECLHNLFYIPEQIHGKPRSWRGISEARILAYDDPVVLPMPHTQCLLLDRTQAS